MPKHTFPPKPKKEPTRTHTRTTQNLSPDPSLSNDTSSKEDLDQDEDNNANLLAAMIRQFEQKSKKSFSSRSAIFLSQKKALYAEARKNVKIVVQAGNDLLEDLPAQLANLQKEEVGFKKYFEDSHLPMVAQKDAFHELSDLYPPLLRDIGTSRAERINAASRLLRNNGQSRQDALKDASKIARQQLEQAKQIEKDAVDATELIKHIKNLLRA